MNLLAYVQMRNVHNSTGHGRVARLLVEHLAREPQTDMKILADELDYKKTIGHLGAEWQAFDYRFFNQDTSVQQRQWLLSQSPVAETYWPEADVTFCTNQSYIPVRKSRLAVLLHDVAIFEPGAHRSEWMLYNRRIRAKIMHWMLARKADLILTISHYSADRIAAVFPALRRRLRVVHHGVPPRFFREVHPSGEAFLVRAQLKNRPFVLLSGGLNFRKNADLVLQAWPMIREKHPDLVLAVPGNCEARYGKQACQDPTIRLLGFVDDDALCSLYHSASVVWFPTRYEGFGLPVIEAMACGAPVVASDASAIPEIAGDAAILVAPSIISEHVDAVSSVLRDQRVATRLRSAGVEHASRFTWESSSKQIHSLLAGLV